MHWYRDGARQRSKVLYVFRTPSGVRVGRPALDPDVAREIERQHPDITFAWDEVRSSQQVIEISPEPRRRRRPESVGGADRTEERPVDAASEKAPPAEPIPTALVGATSDEQVAFLTEWYPRVRERVTQRVADPERRDALLALTERLNPATWTDADALAEGLAAAAEALERLARVLSRRRRARQRSSAGDGRQPSP
jgi:hypothetical protein